MRIVPPALPQLPKRDAEATLAKFGVKEPIALLGVRGYYRDTMGKAGQNDRGIYDDAIFVVSPVAFLGVNANTDPSADPAQARIGLATLEPGLWRFRQGLHGISRGHPYPALVQTGVFVVRRDGTEGYAAGVQHERWGECLGGGRWRGSYFAINNHKGAYTTTSSEGCQTVFPEQWDRYLALVEAEMERYDQRTIAYCLIEASSLVRLG